MSKFIFDRMSRRMYLTGIGKSIVAAPLLASLLPKKLQASTDSKKKFIALSYPNQAAVGAFRPTDMTGDVVPSVYQSKIRNLQEGGLVPYSELDLSEIISSTGRISRVLDEKFNEYQNKILMYYGIDMPGRIDHGSAGFLGNLAATQHGTSVNPAFDPGDPDAWNPIWQPMMTMDEFLARSSEFYGSQLNSIPIPILRVGELSLSTNQLDGSNYSARGGGIGGNNAPLTLNGDPSLIFTNYISPQVENSTGFAHKLAIDRILQNVNSLKNSAKISKFDKQVLDQYSESLFELESNLERIRNLSQCTTIPIDFGDLAAIPEFLSRQNRFGNLGEGSELVPAYYSHIVKLIGLAIRCGLTKIVTLGAGSSLVNTSYAWAHHGSPRKWHLEGAHYNDDEYMYLSQKWIMDSVLYPLIKELDVASSDGSTYLDETIIYSQPECSYGHSGINLSGLVIGMPNSIKTGKFIDYANWNLDMNIVTHTNARTSSNYSFKIAPGLPYNRFLLAMLQGSGLTSASYYNKFGNGGTTFGVWQNYTSAWEAPFGEHTRNHLMSSPAPGVLV